MTFRRRPTDLAMPRVTHHPGDPVVVPPAWTADALCTQVDHDTFFPEQGASNQTAKATCARCEVSDACLSYALEHVDLHGIWAGTTVKDRERLRRGAA